LQSGHIKIIILYWTNFFETNDFGAGIGSKPFSQCAVGVANCLTTTDRGLFNDSDAIIFHAQDLHIDDLPPSEWRRPHQNFVFFLLESPVHTRMNVLRQPVFRNYFNLTMTYRRDSDVVNSYGRIQCNTESSPSCLDFPLVNGTAVQETLSAIPFQIDLTMKTKTVAWFVSNCETDSRRESLAGNLSRFIPVDIYGKCGDGQHQCRNQASCDLMISRNYRFYLSFENSLCTDYVTEKLYRPLAHDTVPVVYGGSNYSLFLPAGSYINAMDFESPQSLANYLKTLMIDDELYLSYFRWRRQYTVDPKPIGGWCPLCNFLRGITNHKMNKTYFDIAAWWNGQQNMCSSPKTFV
jgi:alpha-1,3-fucosyltransferase